MCELEDSLLLDLLDLLTQILMVITMDLYFLHLATIPLLFDCLLVEEYMLTYTNPLPWPYGCTMP